MKPFNLKSALEGKPVITRGGGRVTIAGYNPHAPGATKLVGWIETRLHSWDADGKYYHDGTGETSSNDLFMAPTEHKEWIVRAFLKNKHAAVYGPYTDEKTAGETAKKMGGSIHEITVKE